MLPHSQILKRHIIEFLTNSNRKHTSLDIEKHLLVTHTNLSKKTIHHVLKELISEGVLAYTYELGTSFLEPSFEKPVRISDRVVIRPERCSYSPQKDDIVMLLNKGASFGSGRHPSTRLALKAMETILLPPNDTNISKHRNALDIGTGSGILAIAAVLMGIHDAIGLDFDPCARSEATQNISLNNLANKIHIELNPLESNQKRLFLVLANLRLPTLYNLQGTISKCLEKKGFAVFSGLKTEEISSIEKHYSIKSMKSIHQFTEKGWASVVLHKTA